ncbi:MAG TPA: hypothetical protein VGK77_16665 [Candidatus Binatia bacterium]
MDLKLTGMKKGSTVLAIEAPVLGETAREQIGQEDFWYVVPKADDTALTLLARSVHDTTKEVLDSDAYDGGVLDSLLQFKSFLKSSAEKVELHCAERPKEYFKLDDQEIVKIQRLKARTPEPHAFMVSGLFDVIEHNRRRFHLVLSNGESLHGTIDTEHLDVEHMRQFWGKKVTIKGTVHFRPSRRPRLIEAQVINPMQEGEEVFETLPQEPSQIELLSSVRDAATRQGWLKEVWGKWPGDEPIEDLLAALKSP